MSSYHGDIDKYNAVKSNCVYDSEKSNERIILSICIPTFLREETLKKTILSVYSNYDINGVEVIVCDNEPKCCLSDNIKIFLTKRRFHNLRYFVNQKNLGMTGNWNRLIQLSKGKYVSFLHDDDLLSDFYVDSIKKSIMNAEIDCKNKIGFIKTSFSYFEDENHLQPLDKSDSHLIKRFKKMDSIIQGVGPTTTPTCGMIFNKEALTEIGGFCEAYYPCADHITGYVLQQSGYIGYYSLKDLAYYRWSVNETLRPKTQIETCKKNYFIREYFYQSSKVASYFGRIFRNAAYSDDINGILSSCNRFGIQLSLEDLRFRKGYSKYSLLIFLLHCLKRLNRVDKKCRKTI